MSKSSIRSCRPWQPDGPGFLHVIGRLRNGATLAAAQSEMNSAAAQINKLGGRASMGNFTVSVFPFQADTVREVRPTLLCLFAGVGLVLLIGCANIANLLMARARRRLRETTIRAALVLLAPVSHASSSPKACCLAFSEASLRSLPDCCHSRHPRRTATLISTFDRVPLDLRVLVFTFAVALGISVLFGLAPVYSVRTSTSHATCKESRVNRLVRAGPGKVHSSLPRSRSLSFCSPVPAC